MLLLLLSLYTHHRVSLCSEARQSHRVVGHTPSCRRNKRSTVHEETVSHTYTYLLIQWLKYKNTNTRTDGNVFWNRDTVAIGPPACIIIIMIYDKYFARDVYEVIFYTLTLHVVVYALSVFIFKSQTLYNDGIFAKWKRRTSFPPFH